MGIRERYGELLKTFHRTLGQARRYGVDSDYSEVKRPTESSIKRLSEVIEKLRTKLWIGRIERQAARRQEADEFEEAVELSDVIIDNFRNEITKMTDEDYQLQRTHSFAPKPSSQRTGGGTSLKEWSLNKILQLLDTAITQRGKVAVATSIDKNAEWLYQWVEDLIFAIYDRKYAEWGGGRAAYDSALINNIYNILMGNND